MEPLTNAARACAVASAAAHDLNNDLTVILSSLEYSLEALESGHPARPFLYDLRRAAIRSAWCAASLLNFAASHGVPPVRAHLDTLVDNLEN